MCDKACSYVQARVCAGVNLGGSLLQSRLLIGKQVFPGRRPENHEGRSLQFQHLISWCGNMAGACADATHLCKACAVGAACLPCAGSLPGYSSSELTPRAHVPGTGRSPEVQLQLCIQEVEQCSPGHDFCVTVIDHQPLVIDVLATDALGPRGQDDNLCLPDVQAWGQRRHQSEHHMQPPLPAGGDSAFVPHLPHPTQGPAALSLEDL